MAQGQYLWFRHTAQTGDADTAGISTLTEALALNGWGIRSVAGPEAVLDLGSYAILDDPEYKTDGGQLGARTPRRFR